MVISPLQSTSPIWNGLGASPEWKMYWIRNTQSEILDLPSPLASPLTQFGATTSKQTAGNKGSQLGHSWKEGRNVSVPVQNSSLLTGGMKISSTQNGPSPTARLVASNFSERMRVNCWWSGKAYSADIAAPQILETAGICDASTCHPGGSSQIPMDFSLSIET